MTVSTHQGTYEWMGLDPKIISETVWKQSAANAINALKTNNDFGFKILDLTIDPKKYKKASGGKWGHEIYFLQGKIWSPHNQN